MVDVERSREVQGEILLAEAQLYERKFTHGEGWERARYCECDADNFFDCTCPKEEKRRRAQYVGRKIEEKFGDRALELLLVGGPDDGLKEKVLDEYEYPHLHD